MSTYSLGVDHTEESTIEGFHSWAMGNLVENRNRGIFAEWLVGQALGVICDGDVRLEWDAYDLSYGTTKVEVKASGFCQAWRHVQPSKPIFSIAPRRWCWDAKTGEIIEHVPPERCADVYVFCLHETKCATDEDVSEHPRYTGNANGSDEQIHATTENVRDPASWEFWVVSKQRLNDELGAQKTVGLTTLTRRFGKPIAWCEIRAALDRCIGGSQQESVPTGS